MFHRLPEREACRQSAWKLWLCIGRIPNLEPRIERPAQWTFHYYHSGLAFYAVTKAVLSPAIWAGNLRVKGLAKHRFGYLGTNTFFGDALNIEAAQYLYTICEGIGRP